MCVHVCEIAYILLIFPLFASNLYLGAMGSGTSKRPEDKAQEVLHKLAVVKAMDSRPVKPPAHQRHTELHEYLARRKASHEDDVLEEPLKEATVQLGETPQEQERREREERLYAVPDEVNWLSGGRDIRTDSRVG